MKKNILLILLILFFLVSCSDSTTETEVKKLSINSISHELTLFLNSELTYNGITDTAQRLYDTLQFDSTTNNDTLIYTAAINPAYFEYFSTGSDSSLVNYYDTSDLEIYIHADYNQNKITGLHGFFDSRCQAGVFGFLPDMILRGNISYADNAITYQYIFSPEDRNCLVSFNADFTKEGPNSNVIFRLSKLISETDLSVDTILINSSLGPTNFISQQCLAGQVYLLSLSTFVNADWLSVPYHVSAGLTVNFDIEFTAQ